MGKVFRVSVVVVVDTLYSHMDTYGVPVGVCSQQARYALLWVLRYTSCSYLRYCRMVIPIPTVWIHREVK